MAAAQAAPMPIRSAALVARSAGRLAAVQALYQLEVMDQTPDAVLKDFISGRQGGVAIVEDTDNSREQYVQLAEADSELLVGIVRCVENRGSEVNSMMANSLSAEWPAERLELIVKSILRAAISELLTRSDIPARATISEFVDVAHAFYPGPEPRMVNAVLDRVARALGRLDEAS